MSAPALFTSYMPLAGHIALRYRIPGSEYQDVRQEALIGLWIAARDHKPEIGPFKPFACVVIERRLQTLLKAALRGKQLVLTEAVRDYDVPTDDACTAVLQRERVRAIVRVCQGLEPLERATLHRITTQQRVVDKRDDNARYTLRRKLKAAA